MGELNITNILGTDVYYGALFPDVYHVNNREEMENLLNLLEKQTNSRYWGGADKLDKINYSAFYFIFSVEESFDSADRLRFYSLEQLQLELERGEVKLSRAREDIAEFILRNI